MRRGAAEARPRGSSCPRERVRGVEPRGCPKERAAARNVAGGQRMKRLDGA